MKPKHLVVDTAGFVKCMGLWEYGEQLCSVSDVVREIRDKQAREKYESLPVPVKLREPQPWAIKFINQFSKKTGDYASLSLADVKILALTYELEIEARGCSDHLRSEPKKPITEGPLPKLNSDVKPDIEGFHLPAEESDRSVTNSSDILLTEPVTGDEESYSSDNSSEICPAVDLLQNVSPALSSSSYKTVNNSSQDSTQMTSIYWRHMLGLEDFLAEHSYIGGYSPTSDDDDLWKALVKEYPQFCPSPNGKYDSLFCALNLPPTTTLRPLHSTFPCIRRWSYHIASFSMLERSTFSPSSRKLVDILHDFGGKSPCWGESCTVPDQISDNKGLLDSALQSAISRLKVDEQNKSNDAERGNINEEDIDGDPSARDNRGSLQEESDEEELEESICEDDMEYKMQENNIGIDEYIEVDGNENTLEEDDYDEEDDCNEEDDDEGWITPSNIKRHKLKNNNNIPVDNEEEGKDVVVACLTSDFAMQNVLKHIGLSVMGIDGKLIWQIRTFILRCYACFKTTSDMTKIFCPKCGNRTLKRVSVTVNPDGTQKIWINFKKPINTKGMRFSLPQQRGGQHARNPVLVADQKEVRQFSSKMSKKKVNPLHEDYDPDTTPFAMRDVYSRAAQLGYSGGKCHNHYYWERKNPNAHVNKYNKKKK